jgi:hypothetical protein
VLGPLLDDGGDLRTTEQRALAPTPRRDAGPFERLLDGGELGVGPSEDGLVAPWRARLAARSHRAGDHRGFLVGIGDRDRGRVAAKARRWLGLDVEHPSGGLEDLRRRTEVGS